MRTSLKTRLSRCIFNSPSGYQVYQNSFFRWLTFGNPIVQTLINRRYPERPSLHYIPAFIQCVLHFPGDCCLLGLGGGGVVSALSHRLPNLVVVAVDASKEVIDIASRYFNITPSPYLIIEQAEANQYLQFSQRTFHHLLIDLHDGEDFPSSCTDDSFFIHAKRVLIEQGFLVLNFIHIQRKMELFQTIQKVFNHCTIVLPIKNTGNAIVIACNLQSRKAFLERLSSVKHIQQITWDPVWGYLGIFKKGFFS